MMIRKLHLTLLALSLCGALATEAPARAQGSQATQARELYRQANKLYDERNLTSAETLYKQAWELQKSYDIASNFGALEMDLGKHAAGAELLVYALSQFPVRGKAEERAALETRLEAAKKLVCTLHLKVTTEGAEILVEGKKRATGPFDDTLFLEPGRRTIEATLHDRGTAKKVLEAKAGSSETLTLTLPAPALLPKPAEPPPAPPRSVVPGVVLGATGALAVGIGGILVGLAEGSRNDALGMRDKLQAQGLSCATPSPSCTQLHGLTARTDAFGNAGMGLLIGGGTVAAAGLAYVLWPSAKPQIKTKDVAISASFGASPSGGGVSLKGSF